MNDSLFHHRGSGSPQDFSGESFQSQNREMRHTLLPGRFDGRIGKLIAAGTHVIALGNFSTIEGRNGFGNTSAHNIAWLDLASGDHLGWRTTPSRIPLQTISDAVWCDAGLFVGGIGGTHCIVPEMGAPVPSKGRGFEGLRPSASSRLAGAAAISQFLSEPGGRLAVQELARSPNTSLSPLAAEGSRALGEVDRRAMVAEVLGRSTTTTLPFHKFQSPESECRTLCVHNGAVVAGFAPSSQNWSHSCALSALLKKSERDSSPIVSWDASRSEWRSLGEISGVVRDVESSGGNNPELYAINHKGGFYRFAGGNRWEQVRQFRRQKELFPGKIKVYGDYLVLLCAGGGSTEEGQPGALIYDTKANSWKELPIEFVMGGGVNDISFAPGAMIVAGRQIRPLKSKDNSNMIVLTREGWRTDAFHQAFRTESITEMPLPSSTGQALLLPHVNKVKWNTLGGVTVTESQIELVEL